MRNLPKIGLHCHLDGSVRPNTVIDIDKKENILFSSDNIQDVIKTLHVSKGCTSLIEYLKRFELPNKIMQSKDSLSRITFELLEDASKENVKYMEIRFAPMLHTKKGLSIKEVIKSVLDGMNKACQEFDIKSNLILGCMRNMSEEDAIKVINEGKEFLGKGVVAVDLCGPEEEGFALKYKNAMDLARSYGYRVTIHAGEGASGSNVVDAIKLLGAERIGHGIRIKDTKEACDLVRESNVILEMCPTSNLQTKTVESIESYPMYDFYKNNIKVSISTDNRTVSNIDLTNELNLIKDKFNLTMDEYKDIYLSTVESTFADDDVKEWLRSLI